MSHHHLFPYEAFNRFLSECENGHFRQHTYLFPSPFPFSTSPSPFPRLDLGQKKLQVENWYILQTDPTQSNMARR